MLRVERSGSLILKDVTVAVGLLTADPAIIGGRGRTATSSTSARSGWSAARSPAIR